MLSAVQYHLNQLILYDHECGFFIHGPENSTHDHAYYMFEFNHAQYHLYFFRYYYEYFHQDNLIFHGFDLYDINNDYFSLIDCVRLLCHHGVNHHDLLDGNDIHYFTEYACLNLSLFHDQAHPCNLLHI